MSAKAPIYLKRGSRRGKKEKLRDILSSDMISPPLGDFRHTIHIGSGGGENDLFGDLSFLQGKFHLLPGRQGHSLSQRCSQYGEPFQFTRTASVCAHPPSSESSPLLKNAISLPVIGAVQALTLPGSGSAPDPAPDSTHNSVPAPDSAPNSTPNSGHAPSSGHDSAPDSTPNSGPVPDSAPSSAPDPAPDSTPNSAPAPNSAPSSARDPALDSAPAPNSAPNSALTTDSAPESPLTQPGILAQTPPPKPPRLHLDDKAAPLSRDPCSTPSPLTPPPSRASLEAGQYLQDPGESPQEQPYLSHAGSLLSLHLDLGPSILDDVLQIMDKHSVGGLNGACVHGGRQEIAT